MKTEAKWWHTEGKRIVCDLCPRECRIGEGQRGFCFVRQNVGGEMVLTTYGKSTGFCVDPIEKKPLNHFLPGTPVLSFGTAGCNLGCKFCQNWDISKSREIEILSQDASPEAIVKAAKDSGCRSIAFTYNDPVIWAEYAIDTAKIARQEGIKTVAVTAGYISPQARDEFFPWIDAANVDLKAFSDVFYRKLTFARIDEVLDTLKWLKTHSDTWFEITNLVIPGQNDSPDELGKMCDWVLENLGPDVPVHFTAFHPEFKMKDVPPTPHETLIEARTLAYQRGIRFAYVGNVIDQERQTTWCPGCGLALIERDHYEMGAYRIKDKACEKCGTEIPGVFENERGDWGRKRMAVKIPQTPSISVSSSRESTAPAKGPRQDFSQDEIDGLLAYARGWVEAAVNGRSDGPELAPELSEISGFGVFITLKRGSMLRACRGQFNETETRSLAGLIKEASVSTATLDTRFPSILPGELDSLALEISPMYDFEEVAAKGEDRAGAIVVGEHGLIIRHPQGSGLLLPQVATENQWDARTFLEHLGGKAGLPKEAWADDNSRIMTFRGRQFVSPAKRKDLDVSRFPQEALRALFQGVDSLARSPQASVSVPNLFAETITSGLGIVLQFNEGLQAFAIRDQASVVEVIQQACRSIRESAGKDNRTIGPLERITFLSIPIQLAPNDEPSRRHMLARCAILARRGSEFAVYSPGDRQNPQMAAPDPIAGALKGLKLTPAQWEPSGATLTAFQIFNIVGKPPESATATPSNGSTRQPWAAGKFYPGDSAEMRGQLTGFFENAAKASNVPRQSHRAVMLPHAGWQFCGDIIAETLQRVEIPDVAIIIGPRHTPHGANWSVTPDSNWQIPGADVPIATDLADRLCAAIPELQKEPEAHRTEHGSEVLIPFLHHLNPNIKVLPIVIGAAGYDDLASLSQALSELLKDSENPPLLVVSSDMNHFANDTENRRRDQLALDQLEAGDARGLFDVCQANDISMCGMRPAVAVMNALGGDPKIEVTRYETSARVTGDAQRVVGYAGAILR